MVESSTLVGLAFLFGNRNGGLGTMYSRSYDFGIAFCSIFVLLELLHNVFFFAMAIYFHRFSLRLLPVCIHLFLVCYEFWKTASYS
jgi:hypothetical protein